MAERSIYNFDEDFMFSRFRDRDFIQMQLIVARIISEYYQYKAIRQVLSDSYCCANIVFFTGMEPILATQLFEASKRRIIEI